MCFRTSVVRPEKWGDTQVGFRGSNASGGRIVLLPGAFWAHGASKMAILGASLLLCILQCFGASEGMLPPGACRSSRASARRIVSCRGLCVSSLCSQIPLATRTHIWGLPNLVLQYRKSWGVLESTLSCPSIPSSCKLVSRSDLVPISFWS